MAKKTVKKKKPTAAKKDVVAFVDHLEKNKVLRSRLRKGWNEVIAAGKKKGFKFTRQELRNHFKKRYGVKFSASADNPDTCICI